MMHFTQTMYKIELKITLHNHQFDYQSINITRDACTKSRIQLNG